MTSLLPNRRGVLFALAMIRDNLARNVPMLVWSIDVIRVWQAG